MSFDSNITYRTDRISIYIYFYICIMMRKDLSQKTFKNII